eukprot:CAMPEP_0113903254 /NCGR_PEP_ID=MMETSP0780_2-20120614/22400_1 /TAXON_ID=652834 /ORGANISM="Palpitomonas bilix" /LENGTH=1202 /DNA_ID=CAMNT_0000896343 /DNA_START=1 /DNA_END=3609 /DNA_ORIENTATION=- /assembly_acc=CAM_ASM_000599
MSSSIANHLDKLSNADKDLRFMAASDLVKELKKEDLRLDGELEKRIAQALLQKLDDASNDVQSMALSAVPIMVTKFQPLAVTKLFQGLVFNIVNQKKQEKREIGVMAFVSAVKSVRSYDHIAVSLEEAARRFLVLLENDEGRNFALDALSQVLASFGSQVAGLHPEMATRIIDSLLPGPSCKRAVQAIGNLSAAASSSLLSDILHNLVSIYGSDMQRSKPVLQALVASVRAAGSRVESNLEEIISLCFSSLENQDDDHDDLKELAFQILEQAILRCATSIDAAAPSILSFSLAALKYDPNFEEDEESETMEEEEEEEEEDEDEEDDDDYSDDDDDSWKIRRAGARCVRALVGCRPDLVESSLNDVVVKLIKRFREREVSVKVDVLHAFDELVRQVLAKHGRAHISPAVGVLVKHSDKLMSSLKTVLRGKGKDAKAAAPALQLLKRFVTSFPIEPLKIHLQTVFNESVRLAVDGNVQASFRVEALQLTSEVLSAASFSPDCLHNPSFDLLLPCLSDRFYRIVAETLKVIAFALNMHLSQGAAWVAAFCDGVEKKMHATDQDQEVKEAAILAVTALLCKHSAVVSDEQGSSLVRALLERMKAELTRLTAVRALEDILTSAPTNVAKTVGLLVDDNRIGELTSFLRKAHRGVRIAATGVLAALERCGCGMTNRSGVEDAMGEVAPLIDVEDWQVASKAILYFSALLSSQVGGGWTDQIVAAVCARMETGSLQSGFRSEACVFLGEAAAQGRLAWQPLFSRLANIGKNSKAAEKKTVLRDAAVLVSAACSRSANPQAAIEELVGQLGSDDATVKQLVLLTVGEMGRMVSLSPSNSAVHAVLGELKSGDEEDKLVASLSLGLMASGNVPDFLPLIVGQLEAHQEQSYLLLYAVREVIIAAVASQEHLSHFQPHISKIIGVVGAASGMASTDEGLRNILGDCVGKLSAFFPNEALPTVDQLLADEAGSTIALIALRSALTTNAQKNSEESQSSLVPMIAKATLHLASPSQDVRRGTLLLLQAVASHVPSLIRDQRDAIMPQVYSLTVKDTSLLRVVNLGPFNHTIDDGLECRKAAFELVDMLSERVFDVISLHDAFKVVANGLIDTVDIKYSTISLLRRLMEKAPAACSSLTPTLAEPFLALFKEKPKKDAVAQEVDRFNDVVVMALKVFVAMRTLVSAEEAGVFLPVEKVIEDGPHKDTFSALRVQQ